MEPGAISIFKTRTYTTAIHQLGLLFAEPPFFLKRRFKKEIMMVVVDQISPP
jgi:hypothetical protein